ncbi:mRNA cleavage and polyadenylation factor CLP1 [[Candida] zeylanoides]
MSIPGFTSGEATFEPTRAATKVHIAPACEWRVEVPFHTVLKATVVDGVGEVFGTELPVNFEMEFTGAKFSIYSPGGCDVEYTTTRREAAEGDVSEYLSEETALPQQVNLHLALEARRLRAAAAAASAGADAHGPKVMVVGSEHSGKTSLMKTLASYALKMDRSPVLVNLNPREGVFSLPGSLTATPVSDILEVDSTNGWGSTTTSGVALHNPKQPLVKNFGFETVADNPELYKYQVSKLGVAVMSRLQHDAAVSASGVLVDTPPLSIKDFGVIEGVVSDFEIDVMVVMGNERLAVELRRRLAHKRSLAIVKVAKSGGVVEVDDAFVRSLQQQTIREYFYGTARSPLSPYNTVVDVKDVVLYRVVEQSEASSSAAFLPSGDSFELEGEVAADQYYARVTEPTAAVLSNSIVAITQLAASDTSGRSLMNTCVKGYAYVSDVDDARGKMRVLLPVPGTLPRNVLIVTAIRYIE